MNSETLRDGLTLVMLALREDFGQDGPPWIPADLTATACMPESARGRARIEARQDGVLCGLPLVEAVFREVAGNEVLDFDFPFKEGSTLRRGDVILRVEGSIRALLAAERTALNFLQHLSGVASLTARLVEKLPPSTRLLDTRKTLPGWRRLDKYAVKTGGGDNHRMGLYDMVLIKENHIRGAGSISAAVSRSKSLIAGRDPLPRIEVEVTNLDELDEAIAAGADVIMLDNFTPDNARKAVSQTAGRARLEISGGITEANIASVADLGVDWISSGALTHSASAFDCSLLIEETGL
jgi:nicotinate-nucleotide pyrophosphorylase (carboxylating)